MIACDNRLITRILFNLNDIVVKYFVKDSFGHMMHVCL